MIILHDITPEDFWARMRKIVREEMAANPDKPLSRKEVAERFGVSLPTVDNMVKRGEIVRVNPGKGYPRYKIREFKL